MNLKKMVGWIIKSSPVRNYLPVIILLFFASPANAQYVFFYPSAYPLRITELPGLRAALKRPGQDQQRIGVLLNLANVYFNKVIHGPKDMDSATYFATAARDLSVRLGDRSGYHYAQLMRAEIMGEQRDFNEARKILNEKLDDSTRTDIYLILSYKSSDNPSSGEVAQALAQAKDLADTAKMMAVRYKLRSREVLAMRYMIILQGYDNDPGFEQKFTENIRFCREIGYPYLQFVYWEVAMVYASHGNGEKALFYSTEAIKKMEETGDSVHASDFYFLQGDLYFRYDDFERSLYYMDKAVENGYHNTGVISLLEILNWKVKILRKQKKYEDALITEHKIMKDFPPETEKERMKFFFELSQIYRDMKQYATAEKYLVPAFNYRVRINNVGEADYRAIGQLYVEWGKYAEARPYLLKALSNSTNYAGAGAKRHLYYLMFLTDSSLGNYLSAMKYRNRYNDIVDNDLRETREKEIKRLSVLYETEKKEAEIKLKDRNIAVLEKDAALKQSQLKSEQQLRRFIIIGVLLLLIISLLLFRQYRMKRKSAEALAKTNDMILRKNEALARLVGEKEWLLKEVHHRVKNNLHTVICLLESQAAYLKNDALDAIHDSQHRIYAMSLIHQKLYQSDDRLIEMSAYLTQFIQYLGESFGSSDGIRFFHDIQPMLLSPVQSVPVALIVNETVTNAIKHAFPDGRKGEISISLFEDEHHQITLEVADNGAGIDLSVLDRRSSSLGISLIRGLAKEIDGEVVFENRNGTVVTVTFTKDSIATVTDDEEFSELAQQKEVFT